MRSFFNKLYRQVYFKLFLVLKDYFFYILKKMDQGFCVYQDFENGECVHFDDLPYLSDYICGNLNADYTLYYQYWYNMYTYSSEAFIVCRWKKSKGLEPIAKWGEAICDDNLVNIFKEHKD